MPLGEGNQGLYTTYSIVLATFLGTMGLPHVVVRFYTNPDGRAARRTTLVVLALLGMFYLLPPIYGALARPGAYGADADDTVVLELPRLMLDGLGGDLLTALVTAGAFAAFLSTSSGLAIAVAGVIAQDVLRRPPVGRLGVPARSHVRGRRPPRGRGRCARDLSVARAVGLAFAVAASTFCPLLVLGIWWRGLTPAGAVAGLLAGGLGAGAGVDLDALRRRAGELARRPARPARRVDACRWPSATMVGVSLLTRDGRARPRQPVHGPAAHPRGRPAGSRMTAARRHPSAAPSVTARRTKPTVGRLGRSADRSGGSRAAPPPSVAPNVRHITHLSQGVRDDD